ncbi:MAG: radical SAM protein [Verrucomicrobiota bacterium]
MLPVRTQASAPNAVPSDPYPAGRAARDTWILSRRGDRAPGDPWRPHGYFLERERSHSSEIVSVATVLLTNRECPWRCVMCDLWKTTLPETVPPGAIPAQIDHAFRALASPVSVAPATNNSAAERPASWPPRQVKLYNGGSFFDPRAIPPEDDEAIAAKVRGCDRVIVECHPAFIGDRCLRFRDLLARQGQLNHPGRRPQLEVAVGLETAHPGVLEKLNKGMSLDQFRSAAEFLAKNGVALRVFVLVQPPFIDEAEALPWAQRSIELAFDAQAAVVSLIPTRGRNGAMEKLAELGQFRRPRLATLEAALAFGLHLGRGRVFADLWDLPLFADCADCLGRRRERLQQMNLTQSVPAALPCPSCGAAA